MTRIVRNLELFFSGFCALLSASFLHKLAPDLFQSFIVYSLVDLFGGQHGVLVVCVNGTKFYALSHSLGTCTASHVASVQHTKDERLSRASAT